ncbi:hypothetical protein RSAG8_09006, partial [Rhizoctonia solani AG-8 WAC10335]
MTSFYGYPCTEGNLHYFAYKLHQPYAGRTNAATKLTWELQERFHELGPFRLLAARVEGELGYVFALGADNCEEGSLPPALREAMENTFGGGPLFLQQSSEKGLSTYTSREGLEVELGQVIM